MGSGSGDGNEANSTGEVPGALVIMETSCARPYTRSAWAATPGTRYLGADGGTGTGEVYWALLDLQ